MSGSAADRRYADALADLHAGDYRRAEELLCATLDAAPRAAQSMLLLGLVMLARRDFGAARSMIDRAYSLKPWVRELDHVSADLEAATEEAAAAVPDWIWPRYDSARRAWFAPGLTFDNVCLVGALPSGSSFVQVGANDGVSADPIHQHVIERQWRGLLVEPLPDVFRRLVANYEGVDGLKFANAAVTATDAVVRLSVERDGRSTLASLVPDRNALGRSAAAMTEIEVPGRPLMALLAEHDVDEVDLFQVDTEGYDYQVLRQLDFARVRPTVIHMEFYCLPLDERVATFDLLAEHGYVYRSLGRDLLAVDHEVATSHFGVSRRALPAGRG